MKIKVEKIRNFIKTDKKENKENNEKKINEEIIYNISKIKNENEELKKKFN